jgi:hypothetical protein
MIASGNGVRPQRREFLLDPGDALGRRILPQDLVVPRERALRFVDRTEEADPRPVCCLDHPRFAVDKDVLPRHDPNLDSPARKQLIQPAVALPVQQCFDLRWAFVPALLERGLAHVLGYRHVGHIEFAVADHLHLRNGRDLLADQLEDRTAEVAGDAVIRPRAL